MEVVDIFLYYRAPNIIFGCLSLRREKTSRVMIFVQLFDKNFIFLCFHW